jgi:hypothetical protein
MHFCQLLFIIFEVNFKHICKLYSTIFPAMDILTNTDNIEAKQLYHPVIHAAMKLAEKKMDCYYSLTDDSAAYRIAMGKE